MKRRTVVKTGLGAALSLIGGVDVVTRIRKMGIEPYYAPSDMTATFVRDDLPKWQSLAREAGVDPM
jgi:tripartite-type tricarboxylate transporter receptor subunit TctC